MPERLSGGGASADDFYLAVWLVLHLLYIARKRSRKAEAP